MPLWGGASTKRPLPRVHCQALAATGARARSAGIVFPLPRKLSAWRWQICSGRGVSLNCSSAGSVAQSMFRWSTVDETYVQLALRRGETVPVVEIDLSRQLPDASWSSWFEQSNYCPWGPNKDSLPTPAVQMWLPSDITLEDLPFQLMEGTPPLIFDTAPPQAHIHLAVSAYAASHGQVRVTEWQYIYPLRHTLEDPCARLELLQDVRDYARTRGINRHMIEQKRLNGSEHLCKGTWSSCNHISSSIINHPVDPATGNEKCWLDVKNDHPGWVSIEIFLINLSKAPCHGVAIFLWNIFFECNYSTYARSNTLKRRATKHLNPIRSLVWFDLW